MKALLTADDVAAILKISKRTAYGYMAKMPHLDRPLRVSERALEEWVSRHTVCPKGQKTTGKPITVIPYRRDA